MSDIESERTPVTLAVFGASGPTGTRVVRQALDAGHRIVAVTRDPQAFPIRSPSVQTLTADVEDPSAVERVLGTRPDAVISTFGVPYSRHPVTVYSRGMENIVRAMDAHAVSRLVCVSSTSVATGRAPGESVVWRRVVGPFVRHVLGRTLYADMTRMEQIVRSSELDWTIVRPAGLFDAQGPSGDSEVSEDRLAGGLTSRDDLAQTLISEAVLRHHPASTIEVMTRSGLPGLVPFLRGNFGRRRG